MDAPFYKFGLFSENTSLVVAFVIGIGFGFFLERAGFGSGNKLARQFYFRDMAVLKVMFTAIVTAMLGVFFLSRAGLLDLSQVYLTPTNLGANVLGGLVLGVGFVVGGYCPGTSVVAAATGRVDAMVYVLGMFSGMLAVGFAMPALAPLLQWGAMGPLTLATAWSVPYGVLVAGVALMAGAAFLAAEWAEVKSGGTAMPGQPLLAQGWSNSRRFLLGFVVLGLVATALGDPYRGDTVRVDGRQLSMLVAGDADHVTAEDLADRLITGQRDLRLVDLRTPEEFARYHLPGAENLPLTRLPSASWRADEGVLLYSGGDQHAAQAWVMLKARGLPSVYELQGGLEAWNERVLFPRLSEPTDAKGKQDNDRKVAVARHFGGSPRGEVAPGVGSTEVKLPPPPPPAVEAAPAGAAPAPKKKKEGC
jgi:rhodanese-related sulfurtransferase